MYLLRFDGFDIVGSSPEAHLKVSADGGAALLHPIAGTRWRGATAERGRRARRRAAGRPQGAGRARDAGRPRPQRPGPGLQAGHRRGARVRHASSATATSCTSSPRWSASCATTGRAFDALAATFPAGTLSGAPKVRAMEIIEELEPTRRGLYGGTVGYFGFGGDMDMAIAIRTALMRDGIAYVQAGGGHRRRLRPGRRGAGDPQQGGRRAGRDRRRRDAASRPMTRRSATCVAGPAWPARAWRSTPRPEPGRCRSPTARPVRPPHEQHRRATPSRG